MITELKPQCVESLGVEAYNLGLGCFPQLDDTLQEIIAQQPENRNELYTAWVSAWKLAHLSRTLNCGS